jgi:putative (di)nucleoside polyphosphate hydrolase
VPATDDYIDSQGFRANVGIVLIGSDGRVFLGGRAGARGWQFPQGGVLRGERAETALYRELEEEIGLERDDVEELGRTRGWLRYRLPPQFRRRNSRPLCIGQKQRWFLLLLQSAVERVRFDLGPEPEFDRCRWVDYWRPVKEVVYFKRPVYVRALHELGPLAFPNDGPPPPPSWWPRRWQRALGEHLGE